MIYAVHVKVHADTPPALLEQYAAGAFRELTDALRAAGLRDAADRLAVPTAVQWERVTDVDVDDDGTVTTRPRLSLHLQYASPLATVPPGYRKAVQ